ncbi:MAG: PmoA family protein [Candidatus Solibacter usitatus]|nr:PmoA family protein [Candidatus Solibacter usitatus]
MAKLVGLLICAAFAACAQGPLAWKDLGGGRMELSENGKTYLVYNYGPQLKAGAPEDRRRCCYIFPAFTPAGVSMLDDFPRDHYHHHGLFWAWPVVETPSGKYDLWMYRGVQHRFEKIIASQSRPDRAVLTTANGWYTGEKKIVRETVRISASPSQGSSRSFEVDLKLEAVDEPVTLRGSQEKGKSYGGFSARFAPRQETVLRSAEGPIDKDEDLVPHKWAELEAVYDGRKASLRITSGPANEGAPYQWCLRRYGFAGASFPGRTEEVQGFTILPGKPLQLKFTVTVTDSN